MEMKGKCVVVADRPIKLRDSGNVMETFGGKQPFPPPFRNHFQGVWQAIKTDFHHPQSLQLPVTRGRGITDWRYSPLFSSSLFLYAKADKTFTTLRNTISSVSVQTLQRRHSMAHGSSQATTHGAMDDGANTAPELGYSDSCEQSIPPVPSSSGTATIFPHRATMRSNIEPRRLAPSRPSIAVTSASGGAAQGNRARIRLSTPEADFEVSAANTRGQFRLYLSDDDAGDDGEDNNETDRPIPEPCITDTMGYMESLIQIKVPDTRFLKGALRLLNVTGLSNAPFASKVSAIAARMVQFYVTYQELEDASDAREEAATLVGDDSEELIAQLGGVVDDDELGRRKRCKDALEKLSQLPKVRATIYKIGAGPGARAEVVWANSAAAPHFHSTISGLRVLHCDVTVTTARTAGIARLRSPMFSAFEHARLFSCFIGRPYDKCKTSSIPPARQRRP
jgi:hypothetical protein